MIYPVDFERKIDFPAVRERVRNHCATPMGQALCDAMRFHTSLGKIKSLLEPVNEMMLLRSRGNVPQLDDIVEIAPWLKEASVPGSFIPTDGLQEIRRHLKAGEEIRDWLRSPDTESAQELRKQFAEIPYFPGMAASIDRTIDRFGEIRPDASPGLREITAKINEESSRMASIVRGVIRDAVAKGILEPDTTPSIRNGRTVIPVPAMSKRAIPGIVHDQSATGRTYYVEPSQAVETGNRIKALDLERRKEITRILTILTDEIRPESDGLITLANTLGSIDFVMAKAKFASEINAGMPHLTPRPGVEWYHAIHPVLLATLQEHGKEPVPLDITLTQRDRRLVISGPNAGGKSVALKTVGMVQYMLQCGLLPPLYSNSHVGIFRNIYLDIGDEQSLRDDLSTYSSHLKNMKYMVTHSGPDTLFLIDEIGSGTEPQIGSALAQAILGKLGEDNAWGIVTTHYQNLKTFADSAPGYRNAAMLYDRAVLQPLFRLSIGNPGSSFALEIARKTGIPQNLIDEAKQIVGSDYVNMDKYLLDLTRDRKYWAEKRQQIKQKEARLESLLEQSGQHAEVLKASRAEIINDARKKAKEIMEGANASIERAIREIREAQAEKERTREIRRQLAEYADSLEKDTKDKEPEILHIPKPRKKTAPKKALPPQSKQGPLEAGQYVRLSDGGVTGKILAIKGNKAEVAFGALRTISPLDKLVRASAPKVTAATQTQSVTKATTEATRSRQLAFSRQLDVRGMRVDEALQAITYYIDDALQFSASQVRILHGTGTGALREAIRAKLAATPAVSDFHDEEVRFGGAGITVVNLD